MLLTDRRRQTIAASHPGSTCFSGRTCKGARKERSMRASVLGSMRSFLARSRLLRSVSKNLAGDISSRARGLQRHPSPCVFPLQTARARARVYVRVVCVCARARVYVCMVTRYVGSTQRSPPPPGPLAPFRPTHAASPSVSAAAGAATGAGAGAKAAGRWSWDVAWEEAPPPPLSRSTRSGASGGARSVVEGGARESRMVVQAVAPSEARVSPALVKVTGHVALGAHGHAELSTGLSRFRTLPG